jgi:hypothetical protein
VHRFAAVGTSGSFFDFQSSFAENKLPIADLALVALLAILCLSELIKRIRVSSRALFIGWHSRALDLK